MSVHQSALWALHALGVSPWPGYSLAPTWPFRVPQFLSAAFWGGLWGMVLMALLAWLRLRGKGRLLTAAIAGALLPTSVGALLMLGGQAFIVDEAAWTGALFTALLVNGAWGAVTAGIADALTRQALDRRA